MTIALTYKLKRNCGPIRPFCIYCENSFKKTGCLSVCTDGPTHICLTPKFGLPICNSCDQNIAYLVSYPFPRNAWRWYPWHGYQYVCWPVEPYPSQFGEVRFCTGEMPGDPVICQWDSGRIEQRALNPRTGTVDSFTSQMRIYVTDTRNGAYKQWVRWDWGETDMPSNEPFLAFETRAMWVDLNYSNNRCEVGALRQVFDSTPDLFNDLECIDEDEITEFDVPVVEILVIPSD